MARTPRARPPWLHPTIVGAAGLSVAAGFAQFGVTAVLGDVALEFGEAASEDEITGQVGLSATTLGIGLAVIRLASLGSLPIASAADQVGRRRVLVLAMALGLALTAVGTLSPSYWVFVAVIALARPVLSTTNGLAGVIAAEETTTRDRSRAIAFVGAAYAVGSGLVAVVRGIAGDALGFRGVLALVLVPLVLLPLLARRIQEPPRFVAVHSGSSGQTPVVRQRLGTVPRPYLGRLLLIALLTASGSLVTGPVFTYLFVYGENVLGVDATFMAVLILVAGPAGLLGLLLGRWSADRLGRRVTAGVAMAVAAVTGYVTYSGSVAGMSVGYVVTVAASGTFAPAAGALAAELFPTRVRATVSGWMTAAGVLGAVVGLTLFGALTDAFASFSAAAAVLTLPVVAVSALYARLPETRGIELEDSVDARGAGQPPPGTGEAGTSTARART